MTIPTIAQLSGHTVLELFRSGYNALKSAIIGKQDKLTAGDNIIISDDNVISAIEGGSLEDYYTKEETNELLGENYYTKTEVYTDDEVDTLLSGKADTDDVYAKADTYTKTEVNTLLEANGYKIIDTITPTVVTESTAQNVRIAGLQDGDIVQIYLSSDQRTSASDAYTWGVLAGGIFVYKTGMSSEIGGEVKIKTLSSGSTTNYISSVYMEINDTTNYLSVRAMGERIGINNGEFTKEVTYASTVVIHHFVVLRRS